MYEYFIGLIHTERPKANAKVRDFFRKVKDVNPFCGATYILVGSQATYLQVYLMGHESGRWIGEAWNECLMVKPIELEKVGG